MATFQRVQRDIATLHTDNLFDGVGVSWGKLFEFHFLPVQFTSSDRLSLVKMEMDSLALIMVITEIIHTNRDCSDDIASCFGGR